MTHIEEIFMKLTFPLKLTYDELFDQLPSFKECFDDDDDYTALDQCRDYSCAYASSPKLKAYLDNIGYTADENGVTVRNEAALRMANAIFDQVCFEYDDIEAPRIDVERHGHDWTTTPTWALWELGGDDDVDYCGSQPSCLTSALLELI